MANVVKPQYRDEKAVKNAIDELYNDEYRIIKSTLPAGMGREDAEVEVASDDVSEENL